MAFTRGDTVEIFPVNFAPSNGTLLIRTGPGTKMDAVAGRKAVSLEADGLNQYGTIAWSVVVKGHAAVVDDTEDFQDASDAGLSPWQAGRQGQPHPGNARGNHREEIRYRPANPVVGPAGTGRQGLKPCPALRTVSTSSTTEGHPWTHTSPSPSASPTPPLPGRPCSGQPPVPEGKRCRWPSSMSSTTAGWQAKG
ncbi:pyridoxamine 5'-phosphate oxidase family protein [Pseudarthrobacter oxydans]|uniref:pyridoxamine 5'-phosphate oxidase family protein n=1 Tax=Pseudarthrobacter oxydans TaxID=1671 RepID=UPI0037F477F0